jgi:hypothetical protein
MSSASGRPPAAIPPKRRDSSTAVWWILGIVAGGIVVMVVFGLALAGVLIHNLHVRNQGQNVEIQTPVGGIKVGHEATVNLPVYPGAESADSHNANVELSAGDEGFAIAVEKYQTTDALDKVSAWYKQRLGPSFRLEERGSNVKIHGVDAINDADMAFVDERGDGARIVALTDKNNCVEIALVRVGKREAQ